LRSLVTIGILIALRQTDELKNHLSLGLSNGLTVREIEEALLQAAAYPGFPAARVASNALSEVLDGLESASGREHDAADRVSSSGRQCREAPVNFTSTNPTVNLMDLMLPGTDGIETMLDIRKRHPRARIIILSDVAEQKECNREYKNQRSIRHLPDIWPR